MVATLVIHDQPANSILIKWLWDESLGVGGLVMTFSGLLLFLSLLVFDA